ncbi:MAG: SDR family NAD(P)-dependent oxidoreductase [Candidatus Bathyarchaeia archaeon]
MKDLGKPLSELLSLKGRRAVVTGSAAGIGEAIACRYAEAGAHLELVDVDYEGLKRVKERLSNRGSEINIHKADLSQREDRTALWHRLGEPDILVNNAAIYPFRSFLKVDERLLRTVMEANLESVFWMCQEMIRRRLGKGGVIINVGSIEAILPFKGDMAHYDVSKAGVIALTRALAREYGRRGFRINAIIPGGIMTPGVKAKIKEILRLNLGLIKSGIEFRSRIPLGRFGHPDEVARMALVLACELSSYVQGALVTVDGGFLSA